MNCNPDFFATNLFMFPELNLFKLIRSKGALVKTSIV
jgi:hypothetical protein